MENRFSEYHPLTILTYFTAITILVVTILHPVILILEFFVFSLFLVMTSGFKKTALSITLTLPFLLFITIINTFSNHQGDTPFLYYNNQPLTIESLISGFFSGILIINLILLYRAYDQCTTPDKFLYIFGRFLPIIGLMVTMIMRFIPFINRIYKKIISAQENFSMRFHKGKKRKRLKNAGYILSALVSVSLEGTIDTADSMKARGYGLIGRTWYQTYSFQFKDIILTFYTLIIAVIILYFHNNFKFTYFPALDRIDLNSLNIGFLILYFPFIGAPILITAWYRLFYSYKIKKVNKQNKTNGTVH